MKFHSLRHGGIDAENDSWDTMKFHSLRHGGIDALLPSVHYRKEPFAPAARRRATAFTHPDRMVQPQLLPWLTSPCSEKPG
jgi:hypothetical protein